MMVVIFLLGTLHIVSNTDYDNTIIKTDSLGNIQWQKDTVSKSQSIIYKSIQQTYDGGYILGGGVSNSSVLTKTDALGNILWTKKIWT